MVANLHADWHYLLLAVVILACAFAVIILAMLRGDQPPTEAWMLVSGVAAHWFGRANGSRSGLERREGS